MLKNKNPLRPADFDENFWTLSGCDNPRARCCVSSRFQFDSEFAGWLTVFDAITAHRFYGSATERSPRRPIEDFALDLDNPSTGDFATAAAACLAHDDYWWLAGSVADDHDLIADCIKNSMLPTDFANHLIGHGNAEQNANPAKPQINLHSTTIRTMVSVREAAMAAWLDGDDGQPGEALHHYQWALADYGPHSEQHDSLPVKLALVEMMLRVFAFAEPRLFIIWREAEVIAALHTGVSAEHVAAFYFLAEGPRH